MLRIDRCARVCQGPECAGGVEAEHGRGIATPARESARTRGAGGAAAQDDCVYVGRDLHAAGEFFPGVPTERGQALSRTGRAIYLSPVLRSAGEWRESAAGQACIQPCKYAEFRNA